MTIKVSDSLNVEEPAAVQRQKAGQAVGIERVPVWASRSRESEERQGRAPEEEVRSGAQEW